MPNGAGLAQVRLLRMTLRTVADLDSAIGGLLLAHPKASLLSDLPRIAGVSLAQILAEVGPILDRQPTLNMPRLSAVSCR